MTRFWSAAVITIALGVVGQLSSAPAGADEKNAPINPYANEPKLLFTSKANWGPYILDLQTRLLKTWVAPKDAAGKVPIMLFKVHENGRLAETKVLRSSGDPAIDKGAQKAMQDTPLKPLPAGAPKDVYFEITFDRIMFGVRLLMQPPH